MAINPFFRITLAARQLGLGRIWLNGLYRLAGMVGLWSYLTPVKQKEDSPLLFFNDSILYPNPPEQFFNKYLSSSDKNTASKEADEIVSGKVRLFGGAPLPLNLNPGTGHKHWSHFEKNQFQGDDIKMTWEPARFGWAVKLARAYLISKNEDYCEAFWRYFETFNENNPPNCGPNWASGQEVAIRILIFITVYQVFKDSPYSTTTRKHHLVRAVASHALRLPPTLIYAHAQSNNHLLVEAAGLYTAAIFLPNHPDAARWKRLGWEGFVKGILDQVEMDGTYTQHSVNYHRLMLQTALWVIGLSNRCHEIVPASVLSRLAAATNWLVDIHDSTSGHVPNLGNNDGAYILPFASSDYWDYRPVLQAASIAFLNEPFFPTGKWEEMALWMDFIPERKQNGGGFFLQKPSALRVGTSDCWATLRAAHIKLRPAHADQLHVDLWAYGKNILLDPGTYLYNANPPWDNPLSQTAVHNTIEINLQNQMLRAGRFLWLNPAQAKILLVKPDEVVAEHDGYRNLGWIHRRSLKYASPDTFIITDRLLPVFKKTRPVQISIQWLFPDWPGTLSENNLEMRTPFGKIIFSFLAQTVRAIPSLDAVQLARCGETISGSTPALPYQGWYSPTYGVKIPALSYRLFFTIHGETTIISKLFIHQTLTNH